MQHLRLEIFDMPIKRSPLRRSPFKTARRRMKVRVDSKLVAWSKAVKAKSDEGRCGRCGGRGSQAHHIAPRGRRPDLRLEVSNGLWCCTLCHLWIHAHVKEATAAGFLSDE